MVGGMYTRGLPFIFDIKPFNSERSYALLKWLKVYMQDTVNRVPHLTELTERAAKQARMLVRRMPQHALGRLTSSTSWFTRYSQITRTHILPNSTADFVRSMRDGRGRARIQFEETLDSGLIFWVGLSKVWTAQEANGG
ncbi:hypothetical protein Tcan_07005 [Toxocara canis]|uniref:Uncharacterized protein n=1 Tax=Toxocara canis TaxID=6265 RepID=A0A0B2VYK1_TOXCA|nr:hypothetical protein Tcan_07005 [Toxocara canis]